MLRKKPLYASSTIVTLKNLLTHQKNPSSKPSHKKPTPPPSKHSPKISYKPFGTKSQTKPKSSSFASTKTPSKIKSKPTLNFLNQSKKKQTKPFSRTNPLQPNPLKNSKIKIKGKETTISLHSQKLQFQKQKLRTSYFL